jgi:hypothetical protein
MCRFVTARGHLAPLPPQVTLVRREIRESEVQQKRWQENQQKD